MKHFFLLTLSAFCFSVAGAQAGRVDKKTGEFSFIDELGGRPYMFYGYAMPSSRSEKLILFSAYPMDIGNNQNYQYPLGAYHETTALKTGDHIIYTGSKNGFAEMKYIDADQKETVFYVRRGHVRP